MVEDQYTPPPLVGEGELFGRVIIVHTFEHVLAALEAASELNRSVALQSAPDAIFYVGSLYLLNMFEQGGKQFPQVDAVFILDCGDAGAEAVGALQAGHRYIRSSAPEALRAKLADIAQSCGAAMMTGPYTHFDLLRVHDAKAACKEWLTAI